MTHDEAYERLQLIQAVLEEIQEGVEDDQLQERMAEGAQSINDGLARLGYIMTGQGMKISAD